MNYILIATVALPVYVLAVIGAYKLGTSLYAIITSVKSWNVESDDQGDECCKG